jgi:hypothetical protein
MRRTAIVGGQPTSNKKTKRIRAGEYQSAVAKRNSSKGVAFTRKGCYSLKVVKQTNQKIMTVSKAQIATFKGLEVVAMNELPTNNNFTVACAAFFNDGRPSLILVRPELFEMSKSAQAFILNHEHAHTTTEGQALFGDDEVEFFCDAQAVAAIGKAAALAAMAEVIDWTEAHGGKDHDLAARYFRIKRACK